MPAKLKNIWLDTFMDVPDLKNRMDLRVDFDNDRHFAIPIDEPFGRSEIATALHTAAGIISNDPDL